MSFVCGKYDFVILVKYDNLGMDYVLKDTPQLTKAEAKEAENMIRAAMK